MKAIRIHQYGDVDQLVYEDAPEPRPGPGEVLIQLAATSINPIDWKILSGAMQQFMPQKFPLILGRDAAGTVKQLGEGVTQFKVGDRVLALTFHTYAELVIAKAAEVARVPSALDLIEAAALPVVTLTGVQLMEEAVAPKPGQKILVTGALGSVGRSAVYAAKRAGAKVIAGVRDNQRTDALELDPSEVFALDDATEYRRQGPFDAVADTVGPDVTAKLLPLIKPDGKLITTTQVPPNAAEYPQVHASGFQVHADGTRLAAIAEDVHTKRFHIPIGRRLPLAQARQGVEAARKGSAGKVLLLP